MTEPQLPIEYGDSGLVARNKINNSRTKLLEDVEAFRPSIGENGNWYIGTTDTGIHAEGYVTEFRVDSGYIQYKYENSNTWNNLIAIEDLKGDTGNGIESVTATKNGKITTITIEFTEDESPYTFQISDGADGQDGRDGTDGQDGQDGQDGADGNGIAGITTNKVGKITTVTVSYTDGSDPDSFEISDGADGQDGTDGTDGVGISDISTSKSGKITTITISYTDGSTPETFQISDGQDGRDGTDGQDGTDGVDGKDGNGISSVTSSKSGKVTTVTISFTDGTTPPFSFTVTDGEDGQGSGDVLGPSSSGDENIVVFDGVSGKLIKDSGKKVPTKVSDLTNDAGFQTSSQVSSAISTATANFITKSVSDLTNYYLKSETYTQTEVNNLIGAIQQFHYEIYPNISDITSPAGNVLYLIGPKGSGSDLYEEYVYTTQFIKIGETSIDLSNYVTTSALNTALSSYVTSAVFTQTLQDYVTTANLSQTLADYVTSSGLTNILANYVTTTSLNSILQDYATTSALGNLSSTVSDLSDKVDGKIDYPSGGTVGQALKKTANGAEWGTVSGGHNYNWETKTISNSSLEIGLRTIVDNPTSNFTLTAPATLEDGMEYVLRCINTNSYTITLGTGFTNPRGVDLKLTSGATDQFVFVAIGGILELQAEIQA